MTNEKLPEEFPQDLVQASKEAATFNGKPVATLATNTTVQDVAGVDPERELKPMSGAVVTGSMDYQKPGPTRNPNHMPLSDGQLMPSNFEEAWKVASMMAKSGMVPRQFVDNPAGIMAVLQTAKERGLNPMSALQNMANVNGRVTGYSELPLGEVYRTGQVESFREYWVSKEGKEIDLLDFKTEYFAAVCELKMKGRDLVRRVFTLDDARAGGLLTNNTKPDAAWFKYRKRMMQMRARGWTLKDGAPDVIAGLPMPEYDEPGEAPGEGPAPSGPSAKEKLSHANRSQVETSGEDKALSSVRDNANGSVPRANVQGDPTGQPGQHDPDVSQAPRSPAQAGVVPVPVKTSVRSPRSRSPRVDNRAAPVPS